MSDRASDEVRRIVHAFPDQGRRDEVRELAAQVRAVEDERDEWRAYATRMDKARINAQSALATSTALAAEQANEIERLKGERDGIVEANKRLRERLDKAGDELCHRYRVIVGVEKERDAAITQRDEAVRELATWKENFGCMAEQRDSAATTERERIASLVVERFDEYLGTATAAEVAAAIRTSHNPEPGGD